MVTVIFFGIMLLGFTFMALRSRRHDRLHGGKLREAPVYRRPVPRPEDWPPLESEIAPAPGLEESG